MAIAENSQSLIPPSGTGFGGWVCADDRSECDRKGRTRDEGCESCRALQFNLKKEPNAFSVKGLALWMDELQAVGLGLAGASDQ